MLSAAVASSSGAKALGVSFSPGLPSQVFEGQRTTISIVVQPASRLCALKIRYKGGRLDRRTQAALHGRASWTLRVPAVPPGTATVSVSCAGAGSVSGTMLVQWALQAPKLAVTKRGYTQRTTSTDRSDVSYGLALRNERVRFDAGNVNVLVNFVDSTNRVLGSDHRSVSRIPAGSTFYVGNQTSISTATPVARLEIIITAATSVQKQISVPPLISDVTIVPEMNPPPGVGPHVDSIRGQLLNHYRSPLQSADLGIVIVDAGGNILGGGSTGAPGPLSYGAREFFDASGTFSAIPLSKAASVLVSPVPTYPTPA
jgi:hypothetical protein